MRRCSASPTPAHPSIHCPFEDRRTHRCVPRPDGRAWIRIPSGSSVRGLGLAAEFGFFIKWGADDLHKAWARPTRKEPAPSGRSRQGSGVSRGANAGTRSMLPDAAAAGGAAGSARRRRRLADFQRHGDARQGMLRPLPFGLAGYPRGSALAALASRGRSCHTGALTRQHPQPTPPQGHPSATAVGSVQPAAGAVARTRCDGLARAGIEEPPATYRRNDLARDVARHHGDGACAPAPPSLLPLVCVALCCMPPRARTHRCCAPTHPRCDALGDTGVVLRPPVAPHRLRSALAAPSPQRP